MQRFTFCDDCQSEYDNPMDRRFHAETIACPSCGPQVELWDENGNVFSRREEALEAATTRIRQGHILAVKGLGGFQLWVHAELSDAILRLRQRKHRPTKPFALLFPSLFHLEQYCIVSSHEKELLTSRAAPIVLVRKRTFCTLVEEIAPDNPYIGAMLPHTPLHHLLMNDLHTPVIATSGNCSDESLVFEEREAIHRLHGIADAFLIHNRPIIRPVDDSIVYMIQDKCLMRRRARGYVPTPLIIKSEFDVKNKRSTILAVGGHLKNTVTVTTDDQIIVSQHIGDLSTSEASSRFEQTIDDLLTLFNLSPQAIVCDQHPDYRSTRFAHNYAKEQNIPLISVQHHHAHLATCLAEHRLTGPVLGIAWDGAGYGLDSTIWGGEFFLVQDMAFKRVAHLRPFRLPGGEVCMQDPRRGALALLYEVFSIKLFELNLPPLQSLGKAMTRSLITLLDKDLNCPKTTSIGRLFDGVSAILGFSRKAYFEGEAATTLEFLAEKGIEERQDSPYRLFLESTPECEEPLMADWRPLIHQLVQDLLAKEDPSDIALKFHRALAILIANIADHFQCPQIVLTGGVFQNALLLQLSELELTKRGFRVYTPQLFAPNDSALSLGQTWLAMNQLTS